MTLVKDRVTLLNESVWKVNEAPFEPISTLAFDTVKVTQIP